MSFLPSAPSWTFFFFFAPSAVLQEGRPAQLCLPSRAFCLLDFQEIGGVVAKGSSALGTWTWLWWMG